MTEHRKNLLKLEIAKRTRFIEKRNIEIDTLTKEIEKMQKELDTEPVSDPAVESIPEPIPEPVKPLEPLKPKRNKPARRHKVKDIGDKARAEIEKKAMESIKTAENVSADV